jgi:hypothetical protein
MQKDKSQQFYRIKWINFELEKIRKKWRDLRVKLFSKK